MAEINRFIEKFPIEVADMLRGMLRKYKEGGMTRQQIMHGLQQKLDPAFNTIDAAVERDVPAHDYAGLEKAG